jgi:hypothetical protein
MRSESKIVGIVLVRNEDRFVGQAVKNIAAFCDVLILCDHQSTDGTLGILERSAAEIPHATLHRLHHPSESHDLLQPFIGTPTWVFGVDGDEIYDPHCLAEFRPRLLAGEFDRVWRMKGNVLHCTAWEGDTATGYLAAPSRSITKLYNFRAISSWDGDTVERLHGGTIRFHPAYDDNKKQNFQETFGWDETPLRCLHTCFLARSSQDSPGVAVRENIMEIYRCGFLGSLRRAANRLVGHGPESRWKHDYYRRGSLVTVDAKGFFS